MAGIFEKRGPEISQSAGPEFRLARPGRLSVHDRHQLNFRGSRHVLLNARASNHEKSRPIFLPSHNVSWTGQGGRG